MGKNMYIIVSAVLIILVMIIAVLGYQLLNTNGNTMQTDLHNFGPAGNFALVDQNGNNVTLNNYTGKVLVIDFIYTHCPSECPIESAKMNDLLTKLQQAHYTSDQFHFLTISFDYKFDNQTTMYDYGTLHLANTSQFQYWSFLSGSESQLNKTFLFGNQYQNVTSEYAVWAQYNYSAIPEGSYPQMAPKNTIEYIPSHNFVLTIVDTHGIRQSVYVGPEWDLTTEFNNVVYLINHPSK